jgi:ribosomal protein L24E
MNAQSGQRAEDAWTQLVRASCAINQDVIYVVAYSTIFVDGVRGLGDVLRQISITASHDSADLIGGGRRPRRYRWTIAKRLSDKMFLNDLPSTLFSP